MDRRRYCNYRNWTGIFFNNALQLVYAASILANEGSIVIPKLNKNLDIKKSKKIIDREKFLKNEIKKEWWNAINEAMFKVVNQENGTAFWTTKNKRNNISGKTGTVQVYSSSQETDEEKKKIYLNI